MWTFVSNYNILFLFCQSFLYYNSINTSLFTQACVRYYAQKNPR